MRMREDHGHLNTVLKCNETVSQRESVVLGDSSQTLAGIILAYNQQRIQRIRAR